MTPKPRHGKIGSRSTFQQTQALKVSFSLWHMPNLVLMKIRLPRRRQAVLPALVCRAIQTVRHVLTRRLLQLDQVSGPCPRAPQRPRRHELAEQHVPRQVRRQNRQRRPLDSAHLRRPLPHPSPGRAVGRSPATRRRSVYLHGSLWAERLMHKDGQAAPLNDGKTPHSASASRTSSLATGVTTTRTTWRTGSTPVARSTDGLARPPCSGHTKAGSLLGEERYYLAFAMKLTGGHDQRDRPA